MTDALGVNVSMGDGRIVNDALGEGIAEGQRNVVPVHCIRVGSQHCMGLGAELRDGRGVRVAVGVGQARAWHTEDGLPAPIQTLIAS